MASHQSNSDLELESKPADRFDTTHWSLVVRAGNGSTLEARDSLTVLCENYWFPLYAFVRRSGYSEEDARDLTQDFFVRLLDKQFLAAADSQKGRFRTFLLAALKHFLANEYDRNHAQKRGGGLKRLSWEGLEALYRLEPADTRTPERIFEQQWAISLLHRVLTRLQTEMEAGNKIALFEALKDHLTGDQTTSYSTTAARLGMTEGAVKVAAYRLRQRYRDLLRDEISQTVAASEEIDEEIRDLFACL